jgi:hypothetical protein
VNKVLKKHEQLFGEPVPHSDVHAHLYLVIILDLMILLFVIGDMQWAVSLGRIDFLSYKVFVRLPCITLYWPS